MALSDADALARAEAEVRAYCGWHIAPETRETLTLNGSGSTVLPLPTLHMTAVHSLTELDQLVDTASFEWSEAGFIRRDAAWTDRLRGVVVDITHGHETMPLDVQAVIDRLKSRTLEADAMSTMLVQVGQVRAAVDDDGLPASAGLSSIDRLVLDRYRVPPRA